MVEIIATSPAVAEFALRMGDTCFILGHRNSEWCGHAPALEEDIALANTALDLIGQTQLWLGLASEAEGGQRTPDNLAFLRDAAGYRNYLLVEQPNGDFGRTIMRQYLFDAWHLPLLTALIGSSEKRVAEIAEKAAKEVAYHLQRSADLVVRLGDGTQESRGRMQAALEFLWPYTGELFIGDAVDHELATAGIAPLPEELRPGWEQHLAHTFADATLKMPETSHIQKGGKRGVHSEHLGFILAEMQFLQRAYPGANW
ncbi:MULTISPECIES: 1,2-phenylacetyl-CoA epoxidase subunit PaaC [unclassified Beijerinckia]|uniref:1,2-phenylacetyl-CoA epoxidase subunit PaaC n=1 Tax=unclassified Beijerinckia TaxID=2638183 RepID=UPI0008967C04|nr:MULTISPECIES: 1,2-phenylacetyl-CoA epoxidase subunit PaaC [unclassified Beijerinckia]MDH7798988.1 ring-1,2-phenylacetyl-CoA epoxidase subunit PaaC [Beijerinckia sp. GAS462]SED85097.1 ring-1,2-phenylacetyl-CoA epoxidase subunit PaaC [Beijerinckia sp. 28-YEA-48]